jgi:SAM-dependent methyltransferase
MENLEDRHKIEEEFHDSKAIHGVDDFYRYGALSLADETLFSSLGDLHGKHLLEIGCGDGTGTLRFARAGAFVTAIDISGEMVELTKQVVRAEGLGGRVQAFRMGGENIEFPEASFDIVYGHSILHHLNLDIAGPRIARVLKPGGVAAFLEPLEYNPVLNLFRRLTPQRRTPTEKPIRWEQFRALGSDFGDWRHEEFYLVSLLAFAWYYGIRSKSMFALTQELLCKCDRALFRLFPFLRRYAWVTVVHFVK